MVIDSCTISWVVNWSRIGLVSDYIVNYYDFVFLKLQSHDIAVVFDRYHDFSIKSSTRAGRGKFSARILFLTPSLPLPAKSIMLTSVSCKSQIIRYITDDTNSYLRLLFQHLADFRSLSNSYWKNLWDCIRRTGPEEEANLIMLQQTYQKSSL